MQDESRALFARQPAESEQVERQGRLEEWVHNRKRHVKTADNAWGSLICRDEMRYSTQPQRDSLSIPKNQKTTTEDSHTL